MSAPADAGLPLDCPWCGAELAYSSAQKRMECTGCNCRGWYYCAQATAEETPECFIEARERHFLGRWYELLLWSSVWLTVIGFGLLVWFAAGMWLWERANGR